MGTLILTGTSVTVKYNTSGAPEWTAPFSGRDITLANDGSIYVTGFSDIDFGAAKLDSSGSNVWVRMTDLYGLSYKDHSDKVATDDMGNVYVAGGGDYVCQFLPRPGIWQCYSRFGIVSYDAEGGTRWISTFPSAGAFVFPEALALRAAGGKLYLCAKSQDWGFYLVQFDPAGEVDWTQDFGYGGSGGAADLLVGSDLTPHVVGGRVWNGLPNVAFVTFKVDGAGN